MKGNTLRTKDYIKKAKRVKFILNEPEKKIPGGKKRKSIIISRKNYSKIKRREELNSILLNHCPPSNSFEFLRKDDIPILQQICKEKITCGTNPMIRKKAILALRCFPSPETINLLSELAEFAEDDYVKSYAIHSLGTMKISLAIPLFIKSMKDKSELVRSSAKDAINEIVMSLGKNTVLAIIEQEKNKNIKNEIKKLLMPKMKMKGKERRSRKLREAKHD